MRALLTNHGFTISVSIAVAITATVAPVFEASQQLASPPLILGIKTTVAELSFRFGAPAATAVASIPCASGSDGADDQENCR